MLQITNINSVLDSGIEKAIVESIPQYLNNHPLSEVLCNPHEIKKYPDNTKKNTKWQYYRVLRFTHWVTGSKFISLLVYIWYSQENEFTLVFTSEV